MHRVAPREGQRKEMERESEWEMDWNEGSKVADGRSGQGKSVRGKDCCEKIEMKQGIGM